MNKSITAVADVIIALHKEPDQNKPRTLYVKCHSGNQMWYDDNGNFHREDGPAVIFKNGDERWYFHGSPVSCQSQEDFERFLKLKTFW